MSETDFTFEHSIPTFGSHGFHHYPSRMLPDLASKLLKLYGSPKRLVFDPFCGSGGVLVESLLSGRPSVGIDINPLACLLASVKTNPISPDTLEQAWGEIYPRILKETAQKSIRGVAKTLEQVTTLKTEKSEEKMRQAFDKLRKEGFESPAFSDTSILYWFKPSTIVDLVVIGSMIRAIPEVRISNFFKVCYSWTVRQVSGTRGREWKLYRIPKSEWDCFNPSTVDVLKKKILTNIKKMKDFCQETEKIDELSSPAVFEGDCRNIFSNGFSRECKELLYEKDGNEITGKVNLVLTSPPYGDSPTTVAYGEFSRYPMVFLGYPLKTAKEIDRISIGGEFSPEGPHSLVVSPSLKQILDTLVERNKKRAQQVGKYFSDLTICLGNIFSLLENNGTCCLVLGNRNVTGIEIPTDKIILEISRGIGFPPPARIFERRIPSKRIPWKIAYSNSPKRIVQTIDRETIIVLSKPINVSGQMPN